MNTKNTWKIIAIIELAAIVGTVLFDLFIPTLVLLGLMSISLFIRREHIAVIGFKRPQSWPAVIAFSFVGAFCLQLFDAGLLMPILNRLTGTTIDYSGFANLQGNLGQLALFLALSWTLAALGEEMAYRGYLLVTLTKDPEEAYTEPDFFGTEMYWSNYGLRDYMVMLAEAGFEIVNSGEIGHGYGADAPEEIHPLVIARAV